MAVEYEKLLVDARRMTHEGYPLARLLAELRGKGATIIQAIKLVRDATGVSLGEAKRLVARDPSYCEEHDANVDLHEDIVRSLEDLEK